MPKPRYIKIKASEAAVRAGSRIPRPLMRGQGFRSKGERFYNSDGYKPGGAFTRWVLKDSHHLRLQAEGAIEITDEAKEARFQTIMAEESAREAAKVAEGAARCGATTQAGEPCKNAPLDDSGFCAAHQPDDDEPDEGDGDDS